MFQKYLKSSLNLKKIKHKNFFCITISKSSFFDSTSLLRTNLGGANSVLRGLCSDQAESMDSTLKIDLFNFMFAKQGKHNIEDIEYHIKINKTNS